MSFLLEIFHFRLQKKLAKEKIENLYISDIIPRKYRNLEIGNEMIKPISFNIFAIQKEN